MLNSEECNSAYQQLVEIMRQFRLDWIVYQVEEQIRLGKSEQKEVDTLKEVPQDRYMNSLSPSRSLRKGPKALLTITREYTPRERLMELVDGLMRAVADRVDMEVASTEYFTHAPARPEGEQELTGQSVRESEGMLRSESGIVGYFDGVHQGPPLTRESASARAKYASKLRALLDELRKEIL